MVQKNKYKKFYKLRKEWKEKINVSSHYEPYNYTTSVRIGRIISIRHHHTRKYIPYYSYIKNCFDDKYIENQNEIIEKDGYKKIECSVFDYYENIVDK